jgi:branched-chain amino acid transport system substrate-binding protein
MALTTEMFSLPEIGRQARLAVAVGAAALLLAACSSASTSTSTSTSKVSSVPIGVVNALTGSDASAGLDTMRGAELAVQIINGTYPDIPLPFAATAGLPNLGGAKIKLFTMDSQSSPQTGASAVSQLVSADHVAAIEGGYASADTQTESAQADRLGIPFVNGASSAGSLTQRGLTWFFHVGPTDLNFGQQMFAFLKQEAAAGHPVSKIAILHTNDPYGNGVEQVTKTLAAQAGYTVVADVAYDAKSTTDLTPEVEKIRAANPDVLFDSSYTADAILLMQTLNRLSYYPGMILAYGAGFSDPTFLPTLKSLAEGVMSRAAWSVEIPNVASKMVAAMFQKEYGRPMTENSARSFTAMMALATAINNAASITPSKILSALESVNIPAKDLIVPWQGVKFNSSHQNIYATGIVQQVQGDAYNVIYPPQYAVAKAVWPLSVARSHPF